MGISGITSTNSMSGMQMLTAGSTDPKIKNIQNEITNAQQQMQQLSSKDELSVNEKTTERKNLQKEISSLNTELKQHQEQLRRSQKREITMAELQEDKDLTNEEKTEDKGSLDKTEEKNLSSDRPQKEPQEAVITRSNDGIVILKGEMDQADESSEEDTTEIKTKDTGHDLTTNTDQPRKEMHSIISADSSVQQANQQGAVIARIKDGIAILKGEINQDENRGVNTEKKQDELEKLEKKEQRATTFQFSLLGEANNTMRSASKANVPGIKNGTPFSAENNAFIKSLRISQEEWQASQQQINISFSH